MHTPSVVIILFGNYYGKPNVYYDSITCGEFDVDVQPIYGGSDLGTSGEGQQTIAMVSFSTTLDIFDTIGLNEGGDHETIPLHISDVYSWGIGSGDQYSLLDDGDMNEAKCIKSADMNDKKGFVQFVTGHGEGESNRVLFLSTKGDKTQAIKSSIELPCTLAMNTNAVAFADLDNDGHIDIIMGNSMQMNQVLPF